MPAALLAQIHREHNIPMKKLKQFWSKAQELAQGRGPKNYWAYVEKIFQNMLQLKSNVSMSTEWPEWWSNMTQEQRDSYIKEHPHSHFAKHGHESPIKPRAGHESPVRVKEPDVSDASDFGEDADEKVAEVDEMPNRRKTDKISIKSMLRDAYSSSKEKFHAGLTNRTDELKAAAKFVSGKELDGLEQKRALRFAKAAGTLLLGSLVAVSLFTPMAGLGPELGQAFMTALFGPGVSESSATESDTDTVDAFMDKFHDWLSEQDLNQLAETLKEQHDGN